MDALIAKKAKYQKKNAWPLKQSIKTTKYATEEADEISIPVLAIEYKYWWHAFNYTRTYVCTHETPINQTHSAFDLCFVCRTSNVSRFYGELLENFLKNADEQCC